MAFGNFTLASAVADFGLTVHSQPLFPHVPPVDIGPGLRYALDTCGQLAVWINTEKARSEWLIASLFGELWNRGRGTLFVLSGVDFTVDKEAGLSGVSISWSAGGRNCRSSSVRVARSWRWWKPRTRASPAGKGQCAAEMVAALRFNRTAKTDIETVYGAVTTGTTWKFHRLTGTALAIDTREYLISEVDQILGILLHVVGLNPVPAP